MTKVLLIVNLYTLSGIPIDPERLGYGPREQPSMEVCLDRRDFLLKYLKILEDELLIEAECVVE